MKPGFYAELLITGIPVSVEGQVLLWGMQAVFKGEVCVVEEVV